ncbi:Hypothetical protein BN2458_PEG0462 [Helicobacter typhlonius]|uniref:Uncharacterized protein n=1 Tax=Helicobacter typhlonius TaxID=76936 RepID=A0A0S4PV87_9HELI|nr:Hypothetical protein BN2458_PEG0462 [Helicobacter typhlonius]
MKHIFKFVFMEFLIQSRNLDFANPAVERDSYEYYKNKNKQ